MTGVRGARHGALYAYLEDVQPDGRVTYITEGELDLADRATLPKRDNPPWRRLRTPRSYASTAAAPFPLGEPQRVTFDLLPTSVLFRAGDRIRVTIAAADPDAFQLLPASGKASLPDRPRRHDPVLRGTARGQVTARVIGVSAGVSGVSEGVIRCSGPGRDRRPGAGRSSRPR